MVELGLDLVADNPNLTFVFFIAFAILAVLGSRFGYYALRNRAETELEGQVPIWNYLLSIGLFAALYGLAGVVEIVSSVQLPFKSALMLATTLLLALAIRQIHSVGAGEAGRRGSSDRAARAALAGLVVVQFAVVLLVGVSVVSAAVEGLAALAFLAYGLVFYRDQLSQSRLRGTMLDSLLRHLLPVLAFAAMVSVVSLAVPFGLDRVIVLHVRVVLVIMTATALMTGTIKLRQNLAGL